MSVFGYFERSGSGDLQLGELLKGLKVEGPVLSGALTLDDRRKAEELALMRRMGEAYRDPYDYDPVLRSHSRF